MTTRLKPLTLEEASDPAVKGVIQFSRDGFGDTQMFGLIARSSSNASPRCSNISSEVEAASSRISWR